MKMKLGEIIYLCEMEYLTSRQLGPPFGEGGKKFLETTACGYSKLEARDAECNGTIRFQFGPP